MYSIKEIENIYPPNQRAMQLNIFREYLQHHILNAISHSGVSQKLSFIGGTALRLVYGNPRFSEDLDFDNFGLTDDDFTKLSEDIKRFLEEEGYLVEIQLAGKNAFRCNVRFPKILFENGLSPLESQKVLIQVDSTAHSFVYKPEIKNLSRFETNFLIPVTPLDIIFSQKIGAVLHRPRLLGRDLFDISFILAQLARPNIEYLKNKLGISSIEEARALVSEKIAAIEINSLLPDVKPFIYDETQINRISMFQDSWKNAIL